MNGRDVRYCSHIEVVSLIANTPSVSVWLSVCEPSQKSWQRKVLTQSDHSHDVYKSPKPMSKQQGIPGSFTSASVLVLYIGPVEISGSWSDRGISSKCIQECTRRLLSQRQEFIEVFLKMTLSTMKVLNVSQNCLVQHKRDELFYCGVCTDDEQYFAVVTRKTEAKTSQKLVIDPEVGQTIPSDGSKQARASICHVFKVIPNKSVLVLHGGDKKTNPEVKAKTIPITSCVTIVDAVKGLFIAESGKTTKLFDDSPSHTSGLSRSPKSSSNISVGDTGYSRSSNSVPIYGTASDMSKNKKLVLVDLRPVASHTPSPVKYGGGFPRSASPEHTGPIKFTASASKLSQGLALETPAFRALSPTSIASSMKGSRLGLRRQVRRTW